MAEPWSRSRCRPPISPEFFDKLIGHTSVEDARKYFSATGAKPLREGARRRFPFAGIVFEEDNVTVTLAASVTETLVPAVKIRSSN